MNALPALLFFLGCGASSRPLPASDGDSDVDADSDVDSDSDTDTSLLGRPVRPIAVCGLAGRHVARALVYDCGATTSCDVVLENGVVDLRPRIVSGDCDAEIPYWIECELPVEDFRDLTIWGEEHPDACLCSDCDCGGLPECIELPPEPLGESCDPHGGWITQICLPEVAPAGMPIEVVASNPCGCDADRPAGCSIRRFGNEIQVDAYLGRCGEVCDAACANVSTSCTIYDLEPGTYVVTSSLGSASSLEIRADAPWPTEPTCFGLEYDEDESDR